MDGCIRSIARKCNLPDIGRINRLAVSNSSPSHCDTDFDKNDCRKTAVAYIFYRKKTVESSSTAMKSSRDHQCTQPELQHYMVDEEVSVFRSVTVKRWPKIKSLVRQRKSVGVDRTRSTCFSHGPAGLKFLSMNETFTES